MYLVPSSTTCVGAYARDAYVCTRRKATRKTTTTPSWRLPHYVSVTVWRYDVIQKCWSAGGPGRLHAVRQPRAFALRTWPSKDGREVNPADRSDKERRQRGRRHIRAIPHGTTVYITSYISTYLYEVCTNSGYLGAWVAVHPVSSLPGTSGQGARQPARAFSGCHLVVETSFFVLFLSLAPPLSPLHPLLQYRQTVDGPKVSGGTTEQPASLRAWAYVLPSLAPSSLVPYGFPLLSRSHDLGFPC